MDGIELAPWNRKQALALMIGIDDYRGKDVFSLKGCTHDVENMSATLRDRFGFGVVSLVDAAATRRNILLAMSELLARVNEGDQVLFYWSGHGSVLQLKDGRNFETLVPYDSSRTGDWSDNRDISDRELFGWVCRISDKGAGLTLIIDGCRAGGVVRDLVARPRGATTETSQGGSIDRDKSAFLPVVFDPSQVGRSGWLPISDRYTLLAACESHESCREIEDPNTGQYRGIFSLELQQALLRTDGRHLKPTWRELFEGVASAVHQRFPAQHPQLEGRRDAEVFGGGVLHRPDFYLQVGAREGDRVQLEGGGAHGIVAGSVWGIYPASTRRPGEPAHASGAPAETQGKTLGEVRLDLVGSTRSEGTLSGEMDPGQVREGCRAFEISRPVASRFSVLLDPLAAHDTALVKLIRKSTHLTLVSGTAGEAADVVVHRLRARRASGADEILPGLPAIAEESWAFLDAAGTTQLAPLRKVAAQGSQQGALDTLETLARHRFLTRLEHPQPALSPAPAVELAVFRLAPDPVAIERGDTLPEIEIGTRLAFELRHQHASPLRLNVIALGAASSIEIIFPVRGRSEIWNSTETLKIGFQDADVLQMELPENYPSPGEPTFAGSEEEILFLLSVNTPANLDLVTRPGLRTGLTKRANPSQLALRAIQGISLRDLPPVDALEGQKDWGLLRWRYRLVPQRSAD